MATPLDQPGLWTRMQFLLRKLGTSSDANTFNSHCLDILNDLLKAELGLILSRSVEGQWHPITARSNRRTVPSEALRPVHQGLLEATMKTGQYALRRLESSTAIAVVLRRGAWYAGGARAIGAFYFTVKDPHFSLDPLQVEFLQSTAVLVAVTLDHRESLEAITEKLRALQAHESHDHGPDIEEILDWDSMDPLRADIEASIVGESSVMILGESGTGKTRLATAIAQTSGRTPIIRATLGASDDLNTITSELFGHERGAYSGAISKRTGLVEYADGGTLILDEILNLRPHAQQLLLDFTQFGTYRPLGYQGQEPKKANVRIIAATNGNIFRAITDTLFRQDLYFRLAGVTLTLPPLRARRNEVPELAQRYLRRLDPARSWSLSATARRLLLSDIWDWAGNIRQLQATMQRARDRAVAAGVSGGILDAKYIGLPAKAATSHQSTVPSPLPPLESSTPPPCETAENDANVEDRWTALQMNRSSLDDVERELIGLVMQENRGVVAHAARQLQISRTSLLSRMTTLQIDKKQYRR